MDHSEYNAMEKANNILNHNSSVQVDKVPDEEVMSARSRLDEISRSYHAPSTILRAEHVAYEASVMKLTDNEERLRSQVELALKTQREVFDKKLEKYAAIERNF